MFCWEGKTTLNVGSPIPWAGVLGWTKRGEGGQGSTRVHLFLPLSCVCNVTSCHVLWPPSFVCSSPELKRNVFPSGVSHQACCHSNKESHYYNSCTIGKQIQGPAFSFSLLRRQLPTKKINSPLSWSLWQQSHALSRWNQFSKHLRRSHFMLPDIFGCGPLPHYKPQDAEWIGSQKHALKGLSRCGLPSSFRNLNYKILLKNMGKAYLKNVYSQPRWNTDACP